MRAARSPSRIKDDMINQGMTVMELMGVVAICALLLVIVAPYLRHLYYSVEARRITGEIYALCQHARADAAVSRTPRIICGSADSRRCDGQWSRGVLAFADLNHNNLPDPAEVDRRYLPLELRASSLSWRGFSGDLLRVEAFGIPFASNGTFTYCPGNRDDHLNRQVIVSRGGRVRLSQDNNGDGYHESTSGGPIQCP